MDDKLVIVLQPLSERDANRFDTLLRGRDDEENEGWGAGGEVGRWVVGCCIGKGERRRLSAAHDDEMLVI